MCGRFTLAASPDAVAEFFELIDLPVFGPRYNIAPTQPAPVVRITGGGGVRRFDHLHWGLIPSWAKDPGIGSRMINARGETVASKPSFRAALRQRRCLVVADGFYEWRKLPGTKRKQPHHVRRCNAGLMALAGLWERWEGPDGRAIESCTIITTEPNDLMKPLHDRMPVILGRDDFELWLDPRVNEPESLTPLLVPCPSEELTVMAVGTLVNSPASDRPECVRPLE